jgi:polar amino acid transport system substrate-binding protein
MEETRMETRNIVCSVFALLFAGAILVATPAAAQSPADIRLMTEEYPPFNFDDGGMLKGMSVDLILKVYEKAGFTITKGSIRLMPWARGYATVQKEANTCLFAMTRTAEREPLFKWVGPIAPTKIGVIAKKERNIRVASAAELSKYRVGVVRDDVGEQLLAKAGIDTAKMDRSSNLDAMLKKLAKGRVDVIAYEGNVTAWELKSLGFNAADYETIHVLKEGEVFYAFHRSTPDSVISTLQKALDSLRDDGTQERIVNAYLK